MRSLTLKLSVLFVLVSLVAVLVVALWVGRTVESEFAAYCKQVCLDASCEAHMGGNGPRGRPVTGDLEAAYLDAIRTSLWQAALVAGIIAIGLAALFSRLITGPVNSLKVSAQRIRDGDLSQRVTPQTRDEIGELAVAFNSMAERLEENEKRRRQLLADIVHELRTPLSIIQGNLEAWQDGVVAPTHETIAPVHEEAVLLARLITDLRDLSLAEAGQLSLQREIVDIAALVSSITTTLREWTASQNIRIDLESPDDAPRVWADPIRIGQVLRNLLDNAIRHTPRGGVIEVTIERKPDSFITISVRDAGSGIAPEDLPHVFEHFYKVDPARERSRSGSGIGLAIVKQLVEAHGGSVSVESTQGSGSVFTFMLPLADPRTTPPQGPGRSYVT